MFAGERQKKICIQVKVRRKEFNLLVNAIRKRDDIRRIEMTNYKYSFLKKKRKNAPSKHGKLVNITRFASNKNVISTSLRIPMLCICEK